MARTPATRAVQQEDGSLRVEYADGSVRFVPAAEGNRHFEALSQQVAQTGFQVEGATALCKLRPEDVSAREARRAQELAKGPATR
jgi:hypothetical protein